MQTWIPTMRMTVTTLQTLRMILAAVAVMMMRSVLFAAWIVTLTVTMTVTIFNKLSHNFWENCNIKWMVGWPLWLS